MAEDTEIAPYTVLQDFPDQNIQIRRYESLILVETPMGGEGRNGAFGRLFQYISGENIKQSKIPMTAPVFMDSKEEEGTETSEKIPMTAPVFMDEKESAERMMAFVLPSEYTMESAPLPKNENVSLREHINYDVATIRFNGTLSDNNIQKHKDILMAWLSENNYTVAGSYQYAGYNAPYTLPWNRRNEVLIPVDLNQ